MKNVLIWMVMAVWALGLGTAAGRAQDSRRVVEPSIPETCAVLRAELAPKEGRLTDAEERGHRDDQRIERAMEGCGAGRAVVLRAGGGGRTVFLLGPLRLRAGVTLVVEKGAAIWGSRDPREYDVKPGSCGVLQPEVGPRGPGCKPLLLAEDAPHSGLMGDGVVDGRGGAKMLGTEETWWELAHRAKVEDRNQAVSRILVVRRSDDFTLYRITLRNSPNCHVSTEQTNGFTAWGVKIDTPKWARNTDGIDPQAGTKNVTIAESWIRSGDDNISPKSNENGAVRNVTVRDTHFYNGHGMSIGSQTSGGIRKVLVERLTIDGSDNGLRIKSDRSRGGLVEDVRFSEVCLRDSPRPIVIDPMYTRFGGEKLPIYRGIALDRVHSLRPGKVVMRGLDREHPLIAQVSGVVIDGEKDEDVSMQNAVLATSGGNLKVRGDSVVEKQSGAPATVEHDAAPYDCTGKFVEYPEDRANPVSAELVPPEDKTFYVAADGTGDYYSVQAALDRVPAQGGLVLVAPGTYRERVWVKGSHVQLKSSNRDASKTVIVFDTSQGLRALDKDPRTFPGMATVQVTGDDFEAENITFENDFNRTHKQEFAGSQAQALNLAGDRNILRNVRILGNQDTLYLGAKGCGKSSGHGCTPGRSYFDDCFVSGNVDFIYGDGTAVFESCEIHSTMHGEGGYLTAQGRHYAEQESVFVFDRCRLTAEPGQKDVYLGRPWRPYASVVFLRTEMGPHIRPEGWREWHPGETKYMETVNYAEFESAGPGGAMAQRDPKVKRLTAAEATKFEPGRVLAGADGWHPTAKN